MQPFGASRTRKQVNEPQRGLSTGIRVLLEVEIAGEASSRAWYREFAVLSLLEGVGSEAAWLRRRAAMVVMRVVRTYIMMWDLLWVSSCRWVVIDICKKSDSVQL